MIEQKVLDYIKNSVHQMGFPASIPWKCKISNKEMEQVISFLIKKDLVEEVLVPVDYKNNIHYHLYTNDFNFKEEHLVGQVMDADDFHELDASMFELKKAYRLID